MSRVRKSGWMARMSRPSASPGRIGPQPASSEYNVRFLRFSQNRFHLLPVHGRLLSLVDLWGVEEVIVPLTRKQHLAFRVACRRYHRLRDVHVIANGRRRQIRNVVNEFLHGRVVNIGEQLVPEEGIHPLVERISTGVEGGLFKRTLFAVGALFEPDFGLLIKSDVRRGFDERLRGIDAELFQLLGGCLLRWCVCGRAQDALPPSWIGPAPVRPARTVQKPAPPVATHQNAFFPFERHSLAGMHVSSEIYLSDATPQSRGV